jgi:hypothetical protein
MAGYTKNYDLLVSGELTQADEGATTREKADRKKHFDYLRVHYKHILESGAVLIVNEPKKWYR